jgi:uncharacterized membrane protein
MENFEQILQLIFHPIVLALDAISIFIILYGAIFSFVKLIQSRSEQDYSSVLHKNKCIKAYLGSYILLSLEFLIVVLIRTMISYFLNKEISEFSVDQ